MKSPKMMKWNSTEFNGILEKVIMRDNVGLLGQTR